MIGSKAKFYALWQDYQNNSYKDLFNRIELIHSLQKYVLLASEDACLDEQFMMLKAIASDVDMQIFNQYYSMYLIIKGSYEQAYLLLKEATSLELLDEVRLAIMGIAVNRLNKMSISLSYLEILRQIKFEDHNPYTSFLEYMRLKLEQYGYQQLHNYLKQQILAPGKSYHLGFIYQEVLHEYQKISFELGRYKEVVRFLLSEA